MSADLSDVDVVIPVRIDSDDRLENLETVLAYFDESFRGHRVLVLEHAPVSAASETAAAHGADYHFFEATGCFHKSRVLNLGIALADRRHVLLYDCDVLFPPAALLEARRELADGRLDFVYPYNGLLLQISPERVRGRTPTAVLAELPGCVRDRAHALPPGVEFLHGSHGEPSSGGALMAVRRRLVLAGGFNENIVSYGCEDTELASRLQNLEKRVAWLDGYSAYHIGHRRGPDSHYNNSHASNLAEWRKVESMDRASLEAYVRNGFRELTLDSKRALVVENTPDTFSLRLAPARGLVLDDLAFVLAVGPASPLIRRLVETFLDRLDATYDDYALYLLEVGGYEFQSSAHRDHVLYVHATDVKGGLRAVVEHTTQRHVCLCSPLTDVTPARMLEAVEGVRTGPRSVARLPTVPPAGLPAAHERKLATTVVRTLPMRGDALVCTRDALLASERDAPRQGADGARLDLDALGRRLEAAASAAGAARAR